MDERRPDIWIFRHGETDWSREGKHTGRTDAPLTAAGEREAMALGKRFGGKTFALVLSSPLSRAWETCRIAGYGEVSRSPEHVPGRHESPPRLYQFLYHLGEACGLKGKSPARTDSYR